MQYTIVINQRACIELDLNFNQAAILSVIQNLNSWANKTLHEDEEYYLITDIKLKEELPILGSNAGSYRKWVDQLVEKGLVKKILHKKMRYVRTTKKAVLIFSDSNRVPASTQPEDLSCTSQYTMEPNRVPDSTQSSGYRVPASTTINIPINQDTNIINNTNSKPAPSGLVANTPFEQELIDYRKSIKKPLKTQRGLTGLINSIEKTAKAWNVNADVVKNYMMQKEWQSIEPSYSSPYQQNKPATQNAPAYSSAQASIERLTDTSWAD